MIKSKLKSIAEQKDIVLADKIVLISIDKIKLNPKNRNTHSPEQIQRLVKIIKYQGFRRPITISNRSGLLVCGEGRYLAAKMMRLKQVPVMYQDYSSTEQEYADGIADNAIDKMAELDIAKINLDLIDMTKNFDFELLGLHQFLLDSVEKFIENPLPDHAFEIPKEGFKIIIMLKTEAQKKSVLKLLHIKNVKNYQKGRLVSAHWPDKENE